MMFVNFRSLRRFVALLVALALLATSFVDSAPLGPEGQLVLLEANGHYKLAARMRLARAQTLEDGAQFDNLALAGADEYQAGAVCEAARLWRGLLRSRLGPVF